jgi:hypothetical protein
VKTCSAEADARLIERAVGILLRELGAADTMRFLSQFSTGAGNYTEERERLFEGVTLEEILAEAGIPQKDSGDH